ncbi:MAG: nitroreductase family protein [Deltaproteobacteria bacterium]|nr:nitroreductase family protein [Deltaproteobacteria bacterium]
MMSDYFDLLKKRRSIRDFEDRDVSLEVVHEIIRESCLAPSSMNGQTWRFIVIMERDLIRRLSDESKKNTLEQIMEESDSPRKGLISSLKDEEFNVYYNAPCLVFIAGIKSSFRRIEDCSLAACYFMFSAAARGLGTCWIGLGQNIQDPDLRRIIGLPDNHEIVAPLILGHPRRIPATPRREPRILKTILSQV